jgi:phospholipase/lecithinase/hemolysin
MKNLIHLTIGILLFGLAVCPVDAAFTSLHIFGDTVSTTTNGPGGTYYYGQRFSNGRVWVEVLAQRQGLGANSITNVNWSNSSNNCSYYGDYSSCVVKALTNYPAPLDSNTALFVVWVIDADFVYDVLNYGTSITQWTNSINQSLTNHFKIITNLYAKGIRTLIMPNAVDLSEVPIYSGYAAAKNGFIRQNVSYFNAAFASILNQARTSLPGITIYEPDFFSLLDNVITNAAAYGLTNAGVDVFDSSLTDLSLNGPGTNYIFWDNMDPTAKVHEIMADAVQNLISPVQISNLAVFNCSNRLDVVNMPVGLNGFVDGSTNLVLANWTAVQSFSGTNTTQSIFVLNTNSPSVLPCDGPPIPGPGGAVVVLSQQYYRLRFPFSWSWP